MGIKDGQLVFVQDVERIAFDFNGQRIFYDGGEELDGVYSKITALEDKDAEFETQIKEKVNEARVKEMIDASAGSATEVIEF